LFVIAVTKTIASTAQVVFVDETFIENAVAVLYENGVIKDTLDYDPGEKRYRSVVMAVSGRTYRLTVEAPGFMTVEATAIAPLEIPTTSISHIRNARLDADGMPLDDVTFRFTDPAVEKNYYLAELNSATWGGGFTSNFCVYSYDAVIEQFQGSLDPFENGDCILNTEVLYTDPAFNGRTKEITLSTNDANLMAFEDPLTGDSIRSYLKNYNLSEDYYKYIKSGIGLELVDENPFIEPVVRKGNVKNGYGLFTVYSAAVDTLY
jgi:hypothetical protein